MPKRLAQPLFRSNKGPTTTAEREKALLALPEGADLTDMFEALHGPLQPDSVPRYNSWLTGWSDCNLWHMTKKEGVSS
jgi:hypothetical protein